MPLKMGQYTMTFMTNTGVPPFQTVAGTLNITQTSPLQGTITVTKLITGAAIQGTAVDNEQGITTFIFSTLAGVTPQLDSYGMQIPCGTVMTLMGGTNITQGAASTDPGADACWVATHSGAGEGDEDEDDKERKGRHGR